MERAKSCSILESRAQRPLSAWVQKTEQGLLPTGFIRILASNISKIHQEESLWNLQNICTDAVVFITHVCVWVLTQATLLALQEIKPPPHRQYCFPDPLPSRSCCHRGQHSKWEDHSTSPFAKTIWGRSKARHPLHKQKSSL